MFGVCWGPGRISGGGRAGGKEPGSSSRLPSEQRRHGLRCQGKEQQEQSARPIWMKVVWGSLHGSQKSGFKIQDSKFKLRGRIQGLRREIQDSKSNIRTGFKTAKSKIQNSKFKNRGRVSKLKA